MMTIARSSQIDLSVTPYYHVMTRCVRRSYLCGTDPQTGKDYSHRKRWLVKKFKELSNIFAIRIAAYAVMSNHYHLVLFVNTEEANSWTHEDIMRRWRLIFPNDAEKVRTLEKNGLPQAMLEAKYELWRERLKSISWFMRCINEPIARMSNYEDKCSGRFWEGRFKSQALFDEGTLLSAMAYVDLNPVRAGIAKTPEASEFTSIQERIQYIAKQMESSQAKGKKQTNIKQLKPSDWQYQCDELKQAPQLMPFSNLGKHKDSATICFSLSDYLRLVDATGRIIRQDKKGYISEELSPILERIHLDCGSWFMMVKHLEKNFSYFVGPEQIQAVFKRLERQSLVREKAA